MEAGPIFTYIYVFSITWKFLFQCSGDAKWCKSKQLICDFEIFAIFLASLLFLALTACKLSLIFDVFYFFLYLTKGPGEQADLIFDLTLICKYEPFEFKLKEV